MLALDAKPLICKMLEEKLCHTLSLRRRLCYGQGMTVLLLLLFNGTCSIGKKNASAEECMESMKLFNDEVCHHFCVGHLR
jgi:hypothetical protein